MQPITFTVEGDPKGQPRARAFAMKINGKFQARMYDAGSAEGWKSCVAEAARRYFGREPISQPVGVDITFFIRRPKGHFGSGKNAGILKSSAPQWHVSKPDCDNLLKAVLDALTRLRIWTDDALVAETLVRKRYADGRPGAEITIRPLIAEQQMTLGSEAA